jgi:uncharacterized protein (UPF0548 family)
MFLLQRPSLETITTFIQSQSQTEFTYAELGATRNGQACPGYQLDHNRIRLGAGAACYQQAISAIKQWQMFKLGWVELYQPHTPIIVGKTLGVLINHFSFWSLNATRIVYILDEENQPISKYGFAYGTLPEHGEKGEERFMVEWHKDDDSVWYDLLALSQPNHILAKWGYPVTRYLQKCFARDSKAAMYRAVTANQSINGQSPSYGHS